MKCPLCAVDLVMSERQWIEIDYCPQCRGVWLDRGELDKIIERSSSSASPAPASYTPPMSYDDDYRRSDKRFNKHPDYDDYRKRHKKKRPGDFLSDLFEFGD